MVFAKSLPDHRSSVEDVPLRIPLRTRVRYFFRGCTTRDSIDSGGKGNVYLVDFGFSDFIYW